MKDQKEGIRIDLVKLWRTNTWIIVHLLGYKTSDLAKKVDVSRQLITTLFNNKYYRMTGIQFLGLMEGMRELMDEKRNLPEYEKAMKFYMEIKEEYTKNGLH